MSETVRFKGWDDAAKDKRIAELEAECQGWAEINIKIQEERDQLRAENQRLQEAATTYKNAVQKMVNGGSAIPVAEATKLLEELLEGV